MNAKNARQLVTGKNGHRAKSRWYALPVAGVLAASLLIGVAIAHAPSVSITSPLTGTLYFSSFPATIPINFTLEHSSPNSLQTVLGLNVSVDGTSLLGGPVENPFDNNDACTTAASAAFTSCSTTSVNTATLSKNWIVSAPSGTPHTVEVWARHGASQTDDDEQSVTVLLLSVEYPAPPAIANQYLNANYTPKSLSAKVRGCIISQIAEQHAQFSSYGPKGGPYDEALVRTDAEYFKSLCSAQ